MGYKMKTVLAAMATAYLYHHHTQDGDRAQFRKVAVAVGSFSAWVLSGEVFSVYQFREISHDLALDALATASVRSMYEAVRKVFPHCTKLVICAQD